MAFRFNIDTAEAKNIAVDLAEVGTFVESAKEYLGGASVDKAYWQGAAANEFDAKLAVAREQIDALVQEFETVSNLLMNACGIYRQADGSVVKDGIQLIAAVEQTTAQRVFNI